jgi:hypothetical protein
MTNIVEQINDAFEGLISTTLGVDYQELDYKWSVESNNFRQNSKRYAVVPSSAGTVSGIIRNYTLDHDFQVILTDNYISSNNNDDAKQTAVFLLYENLDDIIKEVFNKKLGLPSIVLGIGALTMDDVEFLEEKVVVLRALFTIKYRNATS